MRGKMQKGDPRPGLDNVPTGWILTPEVEKFFEYAHGNTKRLFEALAKCGFHSIAIAIPGKAVIGWAWNQTEILEKESEVRAALSNGAGSTVVRTIEYRIPPELDRKIRRLEGAVRNLTKWASQHEGWHRTAMGGPEPDPILDDKTLELFPDLGDNEDGGDLPATRMGGPVGSAPGAEKEGA